MIIQAFCAAILFLFSGQTANARSDQTIRAKTELVELRAVVTDDFGKLVVDLKKDDFELLVDKKRQPIDFFSSIQVESGKGKKPAGKSLDVHLREAPARTITLLVDNLHLSFRSLVYTKQALRRFVDEKITAQDAVSLVASAGSLGTEQFTRDHLALRYGIERISPMGTGLANPFQIPANVWAYIADTAGWGDPDARALWQTLTVGVQSRHQGTDGTNPRVYVPLVSYLRNSTLTTLKDMAARMAALPGQRIMIFFSDGFTSGYGQTGELEQAIGSAVRAGVAIYSICTDGLQPPIHFDIPSTRNGDTRTDPTILASLQKYASEADQEKLNGIHALASDTGGQLYHSTNDISKAINKALDANQSYYVLGYYLSDGSDEPCHHVAIKVKGHPEHAVRAPKSFFVETGRTAGEAAETPVQRMIQAIWNPLPSTDINISLSADYLESDNDPGKVTLTVLVDGSSLRFREENGYHLSDFEVVEWIFDPYDKKIQNYADLVQARIVPQTLASARQNGFRVIRRVDLNPGIYQTRIGVREIGTNRMGTTSAWVQVPDLAHTALVLSSLMISEAPLKDGGAEFTLKNASVGRLRMSQGIRLFPPGAVYGYFFRIQKTPALPDVSGLEYQAEIIEAGKPAASSGWARVPTGKQDAKGFTVDGLIDGTKLSCGVYELRVTVRQAASKLTAQRSVIFGID